MAMMKSPPKSKRQAQLKMIVQDGMQKRISEIGACKLMDRRCKEAASCGGVDNLL